MISSASKDGSLYEVATDPEASGTTASILVDSRFLVTVNRELSSDKLPHSYLFPGLW